MEKHPVTILLVEDDQSMLEGMQDLLELAHLKTEEFFFDKVTVITAPDGRIGLQRMQEQTPDLIVSDIMMPHMTGYEFLQEVRKNSEWLQIPFIFLTAKGERKDYDEGKLKGAELYITKPFDSDTFLEHVTIQLEHSFRRRAIQEQHIVAFKKHTLQILNHEFRTPLTYVTAYYEMLAEGVQRDGMGMVDYREYLRGIQVGCVRLSRLVEDFLQVISLRSGEARTHFEQYARPITLIQQVVQEAVDNVMPQARQRRIRIVSQLPVTLPAVFGVADDLRNVFERLLDNAIKFSESRLGEEKTVFITAEVVGAELRIAIIDQGIGFPVHMQNEIYTLFYQHNRAVNEQQGAGTGLTIVKELVELHNGRIETNSVPGEGSTFTVVLPVIPETAVLEWRPNTDAARRRPRATVLVVEDDYHLLTGLEDLLYTLEAYDLKVLTALNGKIGLEMLRHYVPDLIISDIMMPQMSGYEFLQEVRKNPEWLQIPVIFLTAKGEPADKNKAFIFGVDEYITKPYDSDVLLKFVTAQLDRRFRIQKLLSRSYDSLKQTILNLVTPSFRQPLTFVSEYTARLADELESAETEEELRVSLRGIQIGSDWLKRLIEDFMSLAEITTGEAQLAFNMQAQPIYNLGGFLSEFVFMQSKKQPQETIKIVFQAEAQPVEPVHGSIAYLTDVVRRLIEVCVQFASADKEDEQEITVSVEQQASAVRILIRSSTRLPPDVQQIAARILQEDEEALLHTLSLAPSLSIAKGYIALHKGTLSLANEAQGCAFALTLPALRETAV